MKDSAIRARRSLIFAPGNKPTMFDKAMRSGADMVTIDLEDAVAPDHKDDARVHTLDYFAKWTGAFDVEAMVRVNCLRSVEGLSDLKALATASNPPPAIMLTKVKSAGEVAVYDELLSGPQARDIAFHVIIETNEGLEHCHDIARASGRVKTLLFGGVDMAAELGVEPCWDGLLYARSKVVHAAATAGVDLIDVPYLDLNDMAGLEQEAKACVALGFTGKAAIHPKQIAPLNVLFSPSDDDVARARSVVDAFEKSDSGLVVVDNKLIERPVLRSMYRTLAIAEKIQAKG